jgi:hypothetical protein
VSELLFSGYGSYLIDWPLQFHFQFGKQSEVTGAYVQRVGRMGNDNHIIVSHKLCGSQGRMGGLIVVMKEPFMVF